MLIRREGGQRPGVGWKREVLSCGGGVHVFKTRRRAILSLKQSPSDTRVHLDPKLLASALKQLCKGSCFSGIWFFPMGTDFCLLPPYYPEVIKMNNHGVFFRRLVMNSSEENYARPTGAFKSKGSSTAVGRFSKDEQ